jgi:hypothetical protein
MPSAGIWKLTVEPEDTRNPCEMSEEMRSHPLFLNFVSWLGDNEVP